MRERTTWIREEVIAKAAALSKKADPYTMNQPEHAKAQPAHNKYENGDPSSWGEDVQSKNTWEAEYSGGQVKRNEIGMPEMRPETFNHAEKTASDAAIDKKAAVCVTLSRKLLKNASETAIEEQAFAFMHMPDAMLVDTFARLAAQDEEEKKDDSQAKQAQQDEKKDQDQGQKQAQDQKSDDDKSEQAQAKQAQQDEKKDEQAQSKQAQGQQDEKKDEEKKQANGQQMLSTDQVQQMIQSAIQAALAGQGQQAPAPQMPMAQAPAVQSDDQLLDQLLAQDGAPMQGDAMAEMGIELEAPMMDVESSLGPEDAVLKSLFANEESQAQEQMEQGKQAGVRTASTRTVGTRPTAGVSRLGGASAGAPAAGGNDVDRLSSMWASAPDVSDVFGMKK